MGLSQTRESVRGQSKKYPFYPAPSSPLQLRWSGPRGHYNYTFIIRLKLGPPEFWWINQSTIPPVKAMQIAVVQKPSFIQGSGMVISLQGSLEYNVRK